MFQILSFLCFDTDKVGSAPQASTWWHLKWHLDARFRDSHMTVGGDIWEDLMDWWEIYQITFDKNYCVNISPQSHLSCVHLFLHRFVRYLLKGILRIIIIVVCFHNQCLMISLLCKIRWLIVNFVSFIVIEIVQNFSGFLAYDIYALDPSEIRNWVTLVTAVVKLAMLHEGMPVLPIDLKFSVVVVLSTLMLCM